MSCLFKDSDFFKSSFSAQIYCVTAAKKGNTIAVRDSKDVNKTTLQFTTDEWDAFIKGVKNGEFDF